MFSSTKKELEGMFVDLSTVKFTSDTLEFNDYPFEPSIAFRKKKFTPSEIESVDFSSHPPAVKIGNELLFVSSSLKGDLMTFVKQNNIKIIERPDIWSWILEPFLDTIFSDENNQFLSLKLSQHGFSEAFIFSLREEIEIQMLRYNFDTMLWEWIHLGLKDVLCAMRVKYDKTKFKEFYSKAMEIALTKPIENKID